MNEVEKMYENANIKAKEYCDRDSDACMTCCPEWKNRQNCWKYKSAMPPFTAEKQLELIKWLLQKGITDYRIINYFQDSYYCLYAWEEGFKESDLFKSYEEALACLFNYLWQSLTDAERTQIKEILE